MQTDDSSSDGKVLAPKFSTEGWSPEPHPEIRSLWLEETGPSGYGLREHVNKITNIAQHRHKRRPNLTALSDYCEKKHGMKLRAAAGANDVETVIEVLTESLLNPSTADSKGRTALHIACSRGHVETVKVLLQYGADTECRDSVGNTPLHLAACTSNIPIITLLLKAGANVEVLDRRGCSPLHLAQSRLRVLSLDNDLSAFSIYNQIQHVVTMMSEYLRVTGLTSEEEELNSICSKLEATSTKETVDEVNDLLTRFTSLTLQKSEGLRPS